MKNLIYIYVISDGENCKVGISIDPNTRIKNLQTGHPSKLEILALYKVPKSIGRKLEAKCHEQLKTTFVKRGEWFEKAVPILVFSVIEEICEDYLL